MFAYAVRRILVSIPVLLASTFVVFLLVSLAGNPLDALRAKNPPPSPGFLKVEAHRLGLDQPLLERYWMWITGVLHGDLGESVNKTLDIGSEIGTRFFVTIRLVAAAMVLALVLAIIVGVLSAVRQYSITDYAFTFIGFLFLAMPVFWLAELLKNWGIQVNRFTGDQIFFTIGDRSDPSVFDGLTTTGKWADILGHMILPTITLALVSFAAWTRFTRASMLEVLASDYVRLARAKGLGRRAVLRRHALRTALIPLATVTALDVAVILGGAVVTETVYQWRGMGEFLVKSINDRDGNAVLAWLLVAATVVIVFNLAADLLYALLDPRIRYE